MAEFEIVPGLEFADRSAWKANTSLPRLGYFVRREDRTHVFIHHTVTPDSDDTPNIWETKEEAYKRMRVLQTIRPDLGMDVPYNFVAFVMQGDGLLICEGRGEDRRGAHTSGHNTRAIAVSFAGNFEELSVSGIDFPKVMERLSCFLGWLKYDPNHPSYGGPYDPMINLDQKKIEGRNVWAHQDVKATACPGVHIFRHLDLVDFSDPSAA